MAEAKAAKRAGSARTGSSKSASPIQEDGWKPFASFVVEFQMHQADGKAAEQRTTVHYMEADKNETWLGIQNEQLCRWIVSHLPETAASEYTTEAVETRVAIEITEIEIAQSQKTPIRVGSNQFQQAFAGFIESETPFSVRASLEFAGVDEIEARRRPATYSAQLQAYDLTTGTQILLGDTRRVDLVAQQSKYTAVLPEASLQPGTYRLRIIAELQSELPTLKYLEMPLLQVV